MKSSVEIKVNGDLNQISGAVLKDRQDWLIEMTESIQYGLLMSPSEHFSHVLRK